nr:hypothetical protein [Candidatus Cloacimonadota bacterium]
MKKVLLISLLAMMLIGMLTLSACQPKPQEQAEETTTEEVTDEGAVTTEEGVEATEEATEETTQMPE